MIRGKIDPEPTVIVNVAEVGPKGDPGEVSLKQLNEVKDRVDRLENLTSKIEFCSGTEFEPTGDWQTGALTDVTGFHWQRVTLAGIVGEPELVEKALTGEGRNLIARTKEKVGIVLTDGSINTSLTKARWVEIEIEENTSYSFRKKTEQGTRDDYIRIGWYDASGGFLQRPSTPDETTTHKSPTGAKILKVSYPLSAVVQMVKGSTIIPWQPAPEDTHSITPAICDGRLTSRVTYGDYIMPAMKAKSEAQIETLEHKLEQTMLAVTALGGTIL